MNKNRPIYYSVDDNVLIKYGIDEGSNISSQIVDTFTITFDVVLNSLSGSNLFRVRDDDNVDYVRILYENNSFKVNDSVINYNANSVSKNVALVITSTTSLLESKLIVNKVEIGSEIDLSVGSINDLATNCNLFLDVDSSVVENVRLYNGVISQYVLNDLNDGYLDSNYRFIEDNYTPMIVSDNLVINYEFDNGVMSNLVDINTYEAEYSGTLIELGVEDRPYENVYGYNLNNSAEIIISNVQIDEEHDIFTICMWYKINTNTGTTNVITLNNEQLLSVNHSERGNSWSHYSIEIGKYGDGSTHNVKMYVNEIENYIGSVRNYDYMWNSESNVIRISGEYVADFRLYNENIGYKRWNLVDGIVEDGLIDPYDNRLTRQTQRSYNLIGSNLVLKPDKSGEVYDIVVDAWLDGYKEYKVIPYVFTVREELLGVVVESVDDAVVTLTVDENYQEIIGNDQLREDFEREFKEDLRDLLGIEVDRIVVVGYEEGSIKVKFKILPKAEDVKKPSDYVNELLNQVKDINSDLRTVRTDVVKNLKVLVNNENSESPVVKVVEVQNEEPQELSFSIDIEDGFGLYVINTEDYLPKNTPFDFTIVDDEYKNITISINKK